MAQATSIEWTDVSWNPVHGCSKVSPGCAHCYAETLSLRYRQTSGPWTPANAAENVQLKPHKLLEPLSGSKDWRGQGAAAAAAGVPGKLVFVNSMSDLFHEQIPNEFIAAVFGVMAAADEHHFQVLTKRPERMRDWFAWYADEARQRELLGCDPSSGLYDMPADLGFQEARRLGVELGEAHEIPWPLPNVWLGVSIENRRFVHRADHLRATPAAVRFISAEPLLGPLIAQHTLAVPDPCDDYFDAMLVVPFWDDQPGPGGPSELDLEQIDWLIVGGESGPGHRRMDLEWARGLRDAARDAGTALFVKQLGGARPGTQLEDLPEDLRIREFPAVAR
jgi:protein gp37